MPSSHLLRCHLDAACFLESPFWNPGGVLYSFWNPSGVLYYIHQTT
jgi:hypothetical protein